LKYVQIRDTHCCKRDGERGREKKNGFDILNQGLSTSFGHVIPSVLYCLTKQVNSISIHKMLYFIILANNLAHLRLKTTVRNETGTNVKRVKDKRKNERKIKHFQIVKKVIKTSLVIEKEQFLSNLN